MDPLFRPGDPCPYDGCDGRLDIVRHHYACECDPLGEPCAWCCEVIAEGGNARPWILCDTCGWMEKDGGLSAHQIIAARKRHRQRAAE